MRNLNHILRTALLLVLLGTFIDANAFYFTVDGIRYCTLEDYNHVAYDDGGNLEFDGILFEDGVWVVRGENAYSGEVVIPETVTYNNMTYRVTGILGGLSGAFTSCSELTSVTLPNTVTYIGSHAFFNCQNLSKVVLSQSLRHINNYAFLKCESLKTIDLPESLRTINFGAFYASGLKSISIPDSVHVKSEAFYQSSIESVSVSSHAMLMGDHIFDETPWMSNQPSDEVIYIGTHLYCYNGILPSGSAVTVKEGTTGIAGGAFAPHLDNLEDNSWINQGINKVDIPNSVTYIGEEAFKGTQLIKANIPSSVENIGQDAFAECTNLISANVPSAVKHLKDGTFRDCAFLRSITLEEGLESIEDEAFYGDVRLNDFVIPKSVKLIGWGAFENCSALREITINAETIGNNAFRNCTSLTKVTIGDSNIVIGGYAFYKSGINEISIGKNSKYIGVIAFQGNSGASKVTCFASTPPVIFTGSSSYIDVIDDWGWCPFTFHDDTYTQATLFVPEGSEEAYMIANPWKYFAYIKGITLDVGPSDVNGDGEVNIADINSVLNAIINDSYDERLDVNGDGEINIADINEVVQTILETN